MQVPKNVPMHKVTLTLNGVDVGGTFVADADKRTFRGVVTGLARATCFQGSIPNQTCPQVL